MELQTFEFESIASFDGDKNVISSDASSLQEAKEDLFGDGILNPANWQLVDMYPADVLDPENLIFLGNA